MKMVHGAHGRVVKMFDPIGLSWDLAMEFDSYGAAWSCLKAFGQALNPHLLWPLSSNEQKVERKLVNCV